MKLEELIKKLESAEMINESPSFLVYNRELDFKTGVVGTKTLRDKGLYIFRDYSWGHDIKGNLVYFFINSSSPKEFPAFPLVPSIDRTYIIKINNGIAPQNRMLSAYVIHGRYTNDTEAKFMACKSIEADPGEPKAIKQVKENEVEELMGFLRKSSLFPQNERELAIAYGILATFPGRRIGKVSPFYEHFSKMREYASLLKGGA